MCHILRECNRWQSAVTGDASDPAEDYSSLWPQQSDFFLLLLASFIPGSAGSHYPTWNDFNRDTAIPRELSPSAATQSMANWTGL